MSIISGKFKYSKHFTRTFSVKHLRRRISRWISETCRHRGLDSVINKTSSSAFSSVEKRKIYFKYVFKCTFRNATPSVAQIPPFFLKFNKSLKKSSRILFLIFIFLSFDNDSLFSDLRSLAGTTLLSLLATLFMSQLLFVIGVGGIQVSYYPNSSVELHD